MFGTTCARVPRDDSVMLLLNRYLERFALHASASRSSGGAYASTRRMERVLSATVARRADGAGTHCPLIDALDRDDPDR